MALLKIADAEGQNLYHFQADPSQEVAISIYRNGDSRVNLVRRVDSEGIQVSYQYEVADSRAVKEQTLPLAGLI